MFIHIAFSLVTLIIVTTSSVHQFVLEVTKITLSNIGIMCLVSERFI